MGYQIYKYLFIVGCFLVYLTFLGPLVMLINHFFPLNTMIIPVFYFVIFILSAFQTQQALDIFYATEKQFWRALYLSFYEFYGILFLQLRGSKKELPDKLEIDEQTIHSEDKE